MAATADPAAAAVIYAGATAFSWAKALAIPGIQALANIKLLEKQDKIYRNIRSSQRSVLQSSLTTYTNAISALMPELEAAYPDTPQVARYVPIDPCKEAQDLIACNMAGMNRADEWAKCVNQLNQQNAIARAVFFDPKWVENVDLYAMTVADLLRGRFPVTDAPLTGDEDELSAFNARTGGVGFASARNYGLSRGRSRAVGRREMIDEADMMESISPVSRQVDIRDMMSTPEQRIAFTLTQAQLIQNSLQNVFNRDAQKPPYLMAQLNAKLEVAINRLQHQASRASIAGTHVPNYAAILQPQIAAITQGVGNSLSYTPFGKGNAPELQANPYTNYEPEVILPTK